MALMSMATAKNLMITRLFQYIHRAIRIAAQTARDWQWSSGCSIRRLAQDALPDGPELDYYRSKGAEPVDCDLDGLHAI